MKPYYYEPGHPSEKVNTKSNNLTNILSTNLFKNIKKTVIKNYEITRIDQKFPTQF